MSQRADKVARIVQQTVASALAELPDGAGLTVTGVDVTPDLRSCTVWVGVITVTGQPAEKLFEQLFGSSARGLRHRLQREVASQLTTKFVPRLGFRYDTGGAYADRINRLIDRL